MSNLWGPIDIKSSYSNHPTLQTMIVDGIKSLNLKDNFRCIEFACGHGLMVKFIAEQFPMAIVYGLDKNTFSTWTEWKDCSVSFILKDLEDYIKTSTEKFDLVIMINSYRGGWERERRNIFHKWLHDNVGYFITDYSKGIPFTGFKYRVLGEFTPFECLFSVILADCGEMI